MKTRIRAALIGVVLLSFAPAAALADICFSVTGLSRPVGIDFTLLPQPSAGGTPFVGEAFGVCGRGEGTAPIQGTVVADLDVFRAGFNVFSLRPGCSGASAEIVFQPLSPSGNGQWRLPEGSVADVVLTHDPSGNACQTGTPPASACVDSATALCLHQKRFRVTALRVIPAPSALGQVVRGNSESGHFHFSSPDNVELTVKVLNSCGVNNRYWVFASPVTNVQYTLTVTDTQTGTVKTYTNPLGNQGPPTQDTNAFATCP